MYASVDGSNKHGMSWVLVDDVQLLSGAQTLRIETVPGKDGKGWGALDCFVLIPEGMEFRPRLFYKPDERVEVVQEIDPTDAWVCLQVVMSLSHHHRLALFE